MSDNVIVSYIWPETWSGWFGFSLASLVHYDGRHNNHVHDMISLSSGPRVAEARNQVVDIFARQDHADWLLMLDTDMTFGVDLLDRLMEVADPVEAPIVGGLCFAGGRTNDPYPTVYRQIEKDGYVTIDRVYDYPRDALVKVGATGGACMLIHRNALGALKNRYGTTADGAPNPYPWFAEGVVGPDGEPWGEDILFCLRANAIGIPVHVHTGVKLGHVKTHLVDEVYYDNYRATKALDALEADASKTPPTNRAERRRLAREKAAVE